MVLLSSEIILTKADILAKAKESIEYETYLKEMFPVVFEEWEDITNFCSVNLNENKLTGFWTVFIYHEGNMFAKLDSNSFEIKNEFVSNYKLEGDLKAFKIYARTK